jgi:hypothetical protein
VNVIERSEDSVTVFCASVTQNILEKLKSLPERKIRVYSDRPETVAEALDDGHTVESLSAFESVRMV